MIKQICLLTLLMLLAISCEKKIITQPSDFNTWFNISEGSFNDFFGDICIDYSGNYIIAGMTDIYQSTEDYKREVIIYALNNNGFKLWEKRYAFNYKNCNIFIKPTVDNSLITVIKDYSNNTNFLMKLNATGDSLWTKSISDTLIREITDLECLKSGDFLMTGDNRVCKLSSNGSLKWVKTLNYGPNDIELYGSDNFALAGVAYSSIKIVKYDLNGNSILQKSYSFIMPAFCHTIKHTIDNGFVITGYLKNNQNHTTDLLVFKTDKDLNKEWNNIFSKENNEECFDIIQQNNGDFIGVGGTMSFGAGCRDVMLFNLDENGTMKWIKTYGKDNSDNGDRILKNADNGFVLAGTTRYPDGQNIWVIKTSPDGSCSNVGQLSFVP